MTKNTHLAKAMRENGFRTNKSLSIASGVDMRTISAMMNFRLTLYSTKGVRKAWLDISKTLKRLPEDLVPKSHLQKNSVPVKYVPTDELPPIWSSEDLEERVYNLQRDECIAKALNTLAPREERVIRQYYGIGRAASKTFGEIADAFNVTIARIIQIHDKAIRKMRSPRYKCDFYLGVFGGRND